MLLTYLTCTAVTMTTKQFISNQGLRLPIMTSVRTINFLAWSIILFFMSADIPPLYALAIVFVQVLSYVWLFDNMPFTPCGVYNGFLESYMDLQQTIFLITLQFIVAPISVLLADFYLYYFCSRSVSSSAYGCIIFQEVQSVLVLPYLLIIQNRSITLL